MDHFSLWIRPFLVLSFGVILAGTVLPPLAFRTGSHLVLDVSIAGVIGLGSLTILWSAVVGSMALVSALRDRKSTAGKTV